MEHCSSLHSRSCVNMTDVQSRTECVRTNVRSGVEEERRHGGECIPLKAAKTDKRVSKPRTSSMTVQLCDTCSGHCGNCCHVAGLTGARLHHLNCGKVVKMNCTCGVACETVLIKTFLPRGTTCPVLPAQEENNRSEVFPSSFSVQHRHVLCLHCKMATPLKGLQKTP